MGRRTRELLLAAAVCGGLGWALYVPVHRAYVLDPAMRRAVGRLDAEEVRRLALQGADVNLHLPANDGGYPLNTPLRVAIVVGNVESLRVVLSRGASLHHSSNEPSPLLHAVATGVVASVEVLLKAGADPNGPESSEDLPLQAAVGVAAHVGEAEAFRIVQALLRHGADPKIVLNDGFTALAHAEDLSLHEIAGLLRSAGSPGKEACLERIVATGPLYAVRTGQFEAVRRLVRRKASFRVRDARGTTLTASASQHEGKILAYLLAHSRDLDRKSVNEIGDGGTALTVAARRRLWDNAKRLLTAGADPDRLDSRGRSALHYAAERGDTGILPFLFAAGASVNLKDQNGRTPLDDAKDFRRIAMMRDLRAAGASEQATDMRSRRAHEAMQRR